MPRLRDLHRRSTRAGFPALALADPWLRPYRQAAREIIYRGVAWTRPWAQRFASARPLRPRHHNQEDWMFESTDYGHAISRLRGRRTQKECAAAAGIDRPTWNQYERGRVVPAARNFSRIAEGLGVSEDELMEAVIASWRHRTGRDTETEPEPAPDGLFMLFAILCSATQREGVPHVP